MSEIDVKAAAASPVPDNIEAVALQHAASALASLVKVMIGGAGDQARVNASVAVLDRGYGKPSAEAGGNDLFGGLLPVRGGIAAAKNIRDEARAHAVLAVEVLHRISIASESEGARVSASRALLDRGCGAAAIAKLPDDVAGKQLGKREQQQADARAAATGIYRVPSAPGSANDEDTPEGRLQ